MSDSRQVVMALHPDQQSENFKYFEAGSDGGSDSRTDGYYMTTQSFEDFGRPETITVGVVPYDAGARSLLIERDPDR